VHIRKDLLIIAQSEKTVQLSLTDSTTSLAKCFSEIGFKVNYASDMDHAKNLLMHYLPDVIVVDWQLGNNVMQEMESVLSNRTSMTNILVVFYNVPDALSMPEGGIIPNVHYLSSSFSDRDVFKLVTPLIITQSETKSIRRSVESSALGGDIGHGSLIEVMQFIEIGRKTGCLYIVIEKPFGLIYFEQGRLTYAASQAKQGRDAVFEILGLTTGHFHFILDKVSQTKNVNLSTLEILMDWTKTVDEAHRT
jgi:ActR/RegA family two-component response regulator